jgi:hypothetical protein
VETNRLTHSSHQDIFNEHHPITEKMACFACAQPMLNLAQAGKWDELIEQEVEYVQLVESIHRIQ